MSAARLPPANRARAGGHLRLLAALSFALSAASCTAHAARARPLHEGAALPADAHVDRLVVSKGAHTLEAWKGDRLLKVYEVAVGSGGAGPKRMEGDGRTPEGTYRIDSRHHSASYHRFLHVSYPNAADRRAFRQGKASGRIPRDARIGGAIGIHGEKKGYTGLPHKLFDWTLGCIALDNDEIEELYRAVVPGAVIVIGP